MSQRISAAIIGIVVATLVLTGLGTFLFARVSLRTQSLARLERQVTQVADILPNNQPADPATPATRQAQRLANLRQQLTVRLGRALDVTGITELTIDADGTVAGDLPPGVRLTVADVAALQADRTVSGHRGNVLWAVAARPDTRATATSGSRAAFVLTQAQEPFFGPTFRWFLLFAGISVVAGALVSVRLGRRVAGPVLDAVATTRSIAGGDLSVRLHQGDDASDELTMLASSINSMADGLQRARDQERHFVMSVSHDLRTPLTSIRGYAEAIADGMAADPAQAAGVILSESRRLERLVGDLLDLAKLDADRFALDLVATDVGDVVAGTVDGFRPELAEAGLRLVEDPVAADGSLVAPVDVDRLAQVIANLVTNAIQYARTTVWVRTRLEGGAAVIEIADDGPGLTADAATHVFERLYQADNQHLRRSGSGSGLGLAIAAELVGRMGGTIGVHSQVGSGSRFWVRFPLARPAA